MYFNKIQKYFENLKMANSAPSPTPSSFTLRRVKQFFGFSKTSISRTFKIYVMIFRKKIRKYLENQKMDNTAPSPTPRSVILCQVRLRAVWYCAKSDSVQYDTARSQKCLTLRGVGLCAVWYCAVSDSAQYHTVRRFAGKNFVFAGLSMPSMRI